MQIEDGNQKIFKKLLNIDEKLKLLGERFAYLWFKMEKKESGGLEKDTNNVRF